MIRFDARLLSGVNFIYYNTGRLRPRRGDADRKEGHRDRRSYLQPAQDEEEQPPQPEPDEGDGDDVPLEDRPMPKRDRSFSVFAEPHFSQATAVLAPKTSFSKSVLHALQ